MRKSREVKIFLVLTLSLILFLNLFLQMISASAGTLKVTTEHPFLINGRWIPASELKVGDFMTTVDGKKAIIRSIQDVTSVNPFDVFNLEAGIFHNFVVGPGDIVVHNSDYVIHFDEMTISNSKDAADVLSAFLASEEVNAHRVIIPSGDLDPIRIDLLNHYAAARSPLSISIDIQNDAERAYLARLIFKKYVGREITTEELQEILYVHNLEDYGQKAFLLKSWFDKALATELMDKNICGPIVQSRVSYVVPMVTELKDLRADSAELVGRIYPTLGGKNNLDTKQNIAFIFLGPKAKLAIETGVKTETICGKDYHRPVVANAIGLDETGNVIAHLAFFESDAADVFRNFINPQSKMTALETGLFASEAEITPEVYTRLIYELSRQFSPDVVISITQFDHARIHIAVMNRMVRQVKSAYQNALRKDPQLFQSAKFSEALTIVNHLPDVVAFDGTPYLSSDNSLVKDFIKNHNLQNEGGKWYAENIGDGGHAEFGLDLYDAKSIIPALKLFFEGPLNIKDYLRN